MDQLGRLTISVLFYCIRSAMQREVNLDWKGAYHSCSKHAASPPWSVARDLDGRNALIRFTALLITRIHQLGRIGLWHLKQKSNRLRLAGMGPKPNLRLLAYSRTKIRVAKSTFATHYMSE